MYQKSITKNMRGLYNKFIFSMLKETALQQMHTYPNTSSDIEDQLIWLSKYCKKQFDILYVKSMLASSSTNDFEHLIYEQDATGSGPQIISMLVRNWGLARLTNITHSENPQDLYTQILDCYKRGVIQKQEALQTFFANVLEIQFDDLIKLTDTRIFAFKFKELFLTQSDEDFTKLYRKLELQLITTDNGNLKNRIIAFRFPVTNDKPINERITSENQVFNALSKIKDYFTEKTILDKVPEKFFTRKLFKTATMAYGYSEGEHSRMEGFRNLITELFTAEGYSSIPLNAYEINFLAISLNIS